MSNESDEPDELERVTLKIRIAVAAVLLLGGCASPKVVESVQSTDSQLSCEGLQKELEGAEKFRGAAQSSLGSMGGQIITAFMFFPALLISHDNKTTALNAAEARKTHLIGVMSQKDCKPAPAPKEPAKGAQ